MDVIYLVQKEARRRGLSNKTIATYCQCIRLFLKQTKKEIKTIKKQDIRDYLDFLLDKGAAGSTLNVTVCSLKFLFFEILAKNIMFNVKYSKKPKTLPTFLTKEETKDLINSIDNKKHKLMIKLLYSSGIRISELLNLTLENLDLERNYGWVRKGKGNKDRIFILAQSLKEELKNYIQENKVETHLFSHHGRIYSSRTIQEIIKKAAKKAKIKKNVHPHTLRHSFATHLVENGYDIISVQSLLGHSSSDTTMVYLHLANPNLIKVKSPLDNL